MHVLTLEALVHRAHPVNSAQPQLFTFYFPRRRLRPHLRAKAHLLADNRSFKFAFVIRCLKLRNKVIQLVVVDYVFHLKVALNTI
jgi:hypothetical protein